MAGMPTRDVAVREGFEPSMPFDIHTFQACSFGHSDTSPDSLSSALLGHYEPQRRSVFVAAANSAVEPGPKGRKRAYSSLVTWQIQAVGQRRHYWRTMRPCTSLEASGTELR